MNTGESLRIPDSQIEDANSDIVEVVRRYVPIKKAGKNWHACCPFHQEKSPSFTVNEAKGIFHCFGCGESGDAVKFVMLHQGLSFRDAVGSIVGKITMEGSEAPRKAPKPRAIQCSLPGHAEDADRAAKFVAQSERSDQHPYLMRNNTAPCGDCLTLKGSLIVPILNSLGEQVNAAAITTSGIRYAAGNPSFGSTAVLDPTMGNDGKTIICADYAHAWRIWWAQQGKSSVLCCMDAGNLSWMLSNCKDRFTHVGCDPMQADEYLDYGHAVVAVPIDPYVKLDRNHAAQYDPA